MNMEAIEVVKPKKTLIQLVNELMVQMESDEGEVTPELDALLGSVSDKVAACAAVIESIECDADGYEIRAKQLLAKARTRRTRAEWLRTYVATCMRAAGLNDIKARLGASLYCAHFRKSTKVHVLDERSVPDAYLRVVPASIEIDKRGALAAMKDGEAIPGLELQVSEYLVLS